MTRIVMMAIMLIWPFALSGAADRSERFARAMTETRDGNWAMAAQLAGPPGEVAGDLIEWQRLRAGQGTAAEIEAFLERRADWPGIRWLRRKSERAMAATDPARVLAFYDSAPPQTAEGALSYAQALMATGQDGDAQAELVLAWRTLPMSREVQTAYLRDYAAILAPHNAARLDRLIWDLNLQSARAMLSLVDNDTRTLAEARIGLLDQTAGVDRLIAAVPDASKKAPGLALARFVWRDRKGRDDDAIALLLERSVSVEALGEPDKWARRRAALARKTMREGDPVRAYRIAARHFLTEGAAYADLEWLAGYIALRKLGDPATALVHFGRFEAAVRSPISKGRAGYWTGRAQEALGDIEAARAAYLRGAQYQTSFYGLLAAERIGLPFDPLLAEPPLLPSWRGGEFMTSSLLEAGLLLLAGGELRLAMLFLTDLSERLGGEAAGQIAAMAIEMDQPYLAVMIAKRAAREAVILPGAYYPPHPVAAMDLPMAPEMTLAIARRESEFDPSVISGAGARGLMQVMPATARAVADDLGLRDQYSDERLIEDWSYNARLGAGYLARLAGEFDGNVIMMAAGYNAGPSRPMQWIEKFGDPRSASPASDEAIVDWIENIPFKETRNYVMRVAESLPVYRARLGKDPLQVPFSRELAGSTLRAFAPEGE